MTTETVKDPAPCTVCGSVEPSEQGGLCPRHRYDPVAAAAGHAFRSTALVPGWCVQCGGSREVHQ